MMRLTRASQALYQNIVEMALPRGERVTPVPSRAGSPEAESVPMEQSPEGSERHEREESASIGSSEDESGSNTENESDAEDEVEGDIEMLGIEAVIPGEEAHQEEPDELPADVVRAFAEAAVETAHFREGSQGSQGDVMEPANLEPTNLMYNDSPGCEY